MNIRLTWRCVFTFPLPYRETEQFRNPVLGIKTDRKRTKKCPQSQYYETVRSTSFLNALTVVNGQHHAPSFVRICPINIDYVSRSVAAPAGIVIWTRPCETAPCILKTQSGKTVFLFSGCILCKSSLVKAHVPIPRPLQPFVDWASLSRSMSATTAQGPRFPASRNFSQKQRMTMYPFNHNLYVLRALQVPG